MSRRFIGFVHRTKATVNNEARPTMAAFIEGGTRVLEFATEQEEADFLEGILPLTYREVTKYDDLSSVRERHVKWRELKPIETPSDYPAAHIRTSKIIKGTPVYVVAEKIPATYEGLRAGDVVGIPLGGSGDDFACGLTRQGMKIGATVLRIPFFTLKEYRETDTPAADADSSATAAEETLRTRSSKTAKDHLLVAELLRTRPDLFYEVRPRDMTLTRIRSEWHLLSDTMRERIGCEARIRQRLIGRIYNAPDGIFPEGGLEKAYAEAKDSDIRLATLVDEEEQILKELTKALESLDVYREIFKPITGLGPKISARIISAVADIRRFKTAPKFCAYMGVHVRPDGTFPRRITGQLANWSTEGRQALYLLSEQFNKRPDSEWGREFLRVKAQLRKKHPYVVKAPQKLVKIFRAIERFFLRHGVSVPHDTVLPPKKAGAPSNVEIENYDRLYEYFERGAAALREKDADCTLSISNIELEQTLTRLRDLLENAEDGWKSRSTSMYSPGHIHKMATWHTLNRFARHIYKQWWDLEKVKTDRVRDAA